MPWHIESDNPDCSGWAVVLDSNGEVVGCHRTRQEALDHLAALNANVDEGKGMKTKGLSSIEIKDADQGIVAAVFSTFGVIDSDGDVTRPGAFEDGASVRISAYGHASWAGALPVGKGTIRQTKKEAILDGQFFLDTTAGRDTFTVVKELGDLQEWSYGYDPVEFSYGEEGDQKVRFLDKLKVYEVSPVLLGAGVNTRTLVAKSRGELRFSEEAGLVLAGLSDLLERAEDVVAHRREKGKGMGAESTALLEQIEGYLKRLGAVLHSPDHQAEAMKEYLRSVARDLANTA